MNNVYDEFSISGLLKFFREQHPHEHHDIPEDKWLDEMCDKEATAILFGYDD